MATKQNPKNTTKETKAAEQKRAKTIERVVIGLVLAVGVGVLAAVIALNLGGSPAKTESGGASAGTAGTVEHPTHYATIDIKDYGTIEVALDGNSAPETVQNFVSLAESGFYDGLTFHRIMEGFMMQGGDPEGTGNGGSGTNIKGEFSANGVDNPLTHVRGAIAMARAKDYNSASSQFFIVQQDSPHLNGQYAAFGYVTSGMDVVDEVCADAEPVDNNGTIPADKQPVINSIKIREA